MRRIKQALELNSESLHENFLSSRVLAKQAQELHKAGFPLANIFARSDFLYLRSRYIVVVRVTVTVTVSVSVSVMLAYSQSPNA